MNLFQIFPGLKGLEISTNTHNTYRTGANSSCYRWSGGPSRSPISIAYLELLRGHIIEEVDGGAKHQGWVVRLSRGQRARLLVPHIFEDVKGPAQQVVQLGDTVVA